MDEVFEGEGARPEIVYICERHVVPEVAVMKREADIEVEDVVGYDGGRNASRARFA